MGNDTTIIRIREQAEQDGTFLAMVSFDHGPEYPITLRDPFTEQQEQELEWYFEEHLRFPFTKKVRADNAAKSITTYGESLFQQVFQDNAKIIFPYMSAVQKGLGKGSGRKPNNTTNTPCRLKSSSTPVTSRPAPMDS